MSTSELSGGARIHYIFQSIFVKSLEVRLVYIFFLFPISSFLICVCFLELPEVNFSRLMDFLHVASSGGWSMRRLDRWWYSDCNPERNRSKIRIICSRRRFRKMFLSMFVYHIGCQGFQAYICFLTFLLPGVSNYSLLIQSFLHRFHFKFLLRGRYLVC